MTDTFENDNDVIMYALEKVISYARDNRYIFLAQSVWSIASVIGLMAGLVDYIDSLRKQSDIRPQIYLPWDSVLISQDSGNRYHRKISATAQDIQEDSRTYIESRHIHPERLEQALAMPEGLTVDQRANQVLERADRVIRRSEHTRAQLQESQENPLPRSKLQLRKARKVERLQEAKNMAEASRQQRLPEIRNQVIQNLGAE